MGAGYTDRTAHGSGPYFEPKTRTRFRYGGHVAFEMRYTHVRLREYLHARYTFGARNDISRVDGYENPWWKNT